LHGEIFGSKIEVDQANYPSYSKMKYSNSLPISVVFLSFLPNKMFEEKVMLNTDPE